MLSAIVCLFFIRLIILFVHSLPRGGRRTVLWGHFMPRRGFRTVLRGRFSPRGGFRTVLRGRFMPRGGFLTILRGRFSPREGFRTGGYSGGGGERERRAAAAVRRGVRGSPSLGSLVLAMVTGVGVAPTSRCDFALTVWRACAVRRYCAQQESVSLVQRTHFAGLTRGTDPERGAFSSSARWCRRWWFGSCPCP